MTSRTLLLLVVGLLLVSAGFSSSDPTDAATGDDNAAPTTKPATKPTTAPSPFIRPPAKPIDKPVEQVRHVVVISVDGLRPDLLLRAKTPVVRKMMDRGCFSMWARTTPNSITLPSHISMMTGVNPRRHDVEWNREMELVHPLFPAVPTLLEAAKRHGYTTAMAAGKDKFDMFNRPGVLDWVYVPDNGAVETARVTKEAVTILREHRPGVMLIHFPSVDAVGHSKGWGSPEQVKAIEEADKSVGEVLKALRDARMANSTVVILSADHGGAGRTHGPEDPRSRHIPWIITGPGIRKNLDLTTYAKLTVNTEDTFATSCWLLGIPPTVADLDGVPVKQILEPKGGELLQPTTAPTTVPSRW